MAEEQRAGVPLTLSEEEQGDAAALARELPVLRQQLQELDLLLHQQEQELQSQRSRRDSANEAVRKLETSGSFTREQYQQALAQAHQSELRQISVQHQLESLASRRESVDQLIAVVEFAVNLARRIDPEALAQAPPPRQAPSPSPLQEVTVAAVTLPPPSEAAIIEAQEAERTWIAQQMHNGPAQALTNLILRAEICQRLIDADAEAAKSELAELRQTIFQSLQDMRRFIFDVRPMILDDLGLFPALRRFVDDWNAQGHSTITLSLNGQERRFARATEIAAFRIIQDAIKAPEGAAGEGISAVQVALQEATLSITLEAPGSRLDSKSGGVPSGYHTIAQRAAIVGGSVAIETRSSGRALKVTIPAT